MINTLMALLGMACIVATLLAKIAFRFRVRKGGQAMDDVDRAAVTDNEKELTGRMPAGASGDIETRLGQANREYAARARRTRFRVIKNSSA